MSELDQSLQEAYELIEEGNLDSARSILEPIVENDNNNIDAWWLYVHATDDPKQAQKALTNIERLDPNYPGLADLSTQLNETIVPSDESEVSDDWDDDDFEIDEDAPSSRRISVLPLAMIGLMIIAIVIIFSVLNKDSNEEDVATPQPTVNVAASTTIEVLSTVEVTDVVVATEEMQITDIPTTSPTESTPEVEITAEPSSANDEFSDVVAALDDIVLAEDPPQIIPSDLGTTLLVSVCSDPTISLRDQITNTMVALGSASETLTDVEALAISVRNCDNNNDIINTLGVELIHAQSFAQGAITESEFRSKWRRVAN